LAAAVGTVSLWGRPIAYASLYHLRSRAESAFDFSGIEAGRFYSDADGERVVFVDAVDGRRMNGVFIWMRGERRDFVIHADELVRQDGMDAESTLHVTGLHMYKRRRTGWFLDAEVGSVTTGVDLGKLAPVGTKRKAESTIGLMRSEEPEDVAELQWRLSRPLSALLLGFLALRCAGPGARFRSGFRGAVFVITACVLNELLFLAARNLVREGVVGAWPGLWWVHAGVLLYLLLPRIAPLKSRRGLKGFADG
jgi:lipopolysaccharide export system permease protein